MSKLERVSMRGIYLFPILFLLVVSAICDKEFFSNLKECVRKTNAALSDKQIENLDQVRIRIGQFIGVEFTEPIFKVNDLHFDIALREYSYSKKRVVDKNRGEDDGIKLEKEIRQACKVVNVIWKSLFADFYMKRALKLLTYEDLKNGDKRDYEMLLNAGVCYNGFSE